MVTSAVVPTLPAQLLLSTVRLTTPNSLLVCITLLQPETVDSRQWYRTGDQPHHADDGRVGEVEREGLARHQGQSGLREQRQLYLLARVQQGPPSHLNTATSSSVIRLNSSHDVH